LSAGKETVISTKNLLRDKLRTVFDVVVMISELE